MDIARIAGSSSSVLRQPVARQSRCRGLSAEIENRVRMLSTIALAGYARGHAPRRYTKLQQRLLDMFGFKL
jgi:hypothetical protein